MKLPEDPTWFFIAGVIGALAAAYAFVLYKTLGSG
jgi:uncharacterized membrane protein YdcZ (DUF606 family)